MLSPLNRRGHSVLGVGSPEFLFNLQIANSNLQFTNNPGNHGWDLQYTPCGCGVVNENAIDGSYHITPGSGNHYSDEFRGAYGDYFLMSGSDFNVKYGLPNGTDVRIKNGQVGYYVKSTGWSGFEVYDKYGDITQMMHFTLVNTFVEVGWQVGRIALFEFKIKDGIDPRVAIKEERQKVSEYLMKKGGNFSVLDDYHKAVQKVIGQNIGEGNFFSYKNGIYENLIIFYLPISMENNAAEFMEEKAREYGEEKLGQYGRMSKYSTIRFLGRSANLIGFLLDPLPVGTPTLDTFSRKVEAYYLEYIKDVLDK